MIKHLFTENIKEIDAILKNDDTFFKQEIVHKINEIINVVNDLKKTKPLLVIKLSTQTREQFSEFYHHNFETLVQSYPDYNVILLYNGFSNNTKVDVDLKGIEMEKSDFNMFRSSILQSLDKFNEYLNDDNNLLELVNKPLLTKDEILTKAKNNDKFYMRADGKIFVHDVEGQDKVYLNPLLPKEVYNYIVSLLYANGNNITDNEDDEVRFSFVNELTDLLYHFKFKYSRNVSSMFKSMINSFIKNLGNELITCEEDWNNEENSETIIVNKSYYEK